MRSHETEIDISVDQGTQTHIYVVNNMGQVVKEIYKGYLSGGNHEFRMNRENLNAGFYLLMVQSGQETSCHKMIIAQ